MTNELQVFNSEVFGQVTAIEKNGDPWFIAKEISEILGYSLTEKMTRRLDEDEKTTAPFRDSGSNYQTNKLIINESGLYEAIFGSKMPQAKAFKKWVKTEVLPQIRKTGSYSTAITKIPSRSKIASDLQANLKIAKIFGLEGNPALLSANKMTVDAYSTFGINPLLESGVELINEEKTQFFTPTQIGKKINTSAVEVNKALIAVGFQDAVRDQRERLSYVVRDAGKQFCQLVDSGKLHSDGSPVVQVKWSMDILPMIVKTESEAVN